MINFPMEMEEKEEEEEIIGNIDDALAWTLSAEGEDYATSLVSMIAAEALMLYEVENDGEDAEGFHDNNDDDDDDDHGGTNRVVSENLDYILQHYDQFASHDENVKVRWLFVSLSLYLNQIYSTCHYDRIVLL